MAHVLAAAEPLTLLKRPPPQNDGFGDDNNDSTDEKPTKARRNFRPAASISFLAATIKNPNQPTKTGMCISSKQKH